MFTVYKIIEYAIISVLFSVAVCVVAVKPLGIMQECGYNCTKFFKWLKRKDNKMAERYFLLGLCCFLSSGILGLCFSFTRQYAPFIALVAYACFFTLFYFSDRKKALKCPVKYTARMFRLTAVLWLVVAILSYLFTVLLNLVSTMLESSIFESVKYSVLSIIILFIPLWISLANAIAKIYENPHSNSFVKKAENKLKNSKIRVIGITGSYAKTTVKVILANILSAKYKVLATPSSYNTPLGLSKVINSNNLDDFDFFIAEMGARNVGDISQLCKSFPPEYSLITGICPQHIETFKTLENIISTKAEILQATQKKSFISADCFNLFDAYNCDKTACQCVSEVAADDCGVNFKLTIGENSQCVHSNLLGVHSAYNIGLAASLAYELGVPFDDICIAIESLGYIPHRLQPLECDSITVIDDAYNANIEGAKRALEVLNLFKGKKIVVTPGLVELGILEKTENFALGERLAGFDTVILVGETLNTPIKEGYKSAGGESDKLVCVPTLDAAREELPKHLEEGAVVLFLNDLPDIF